MIGLGLGKTIAQLPDGKSLAFGSRRAACKQVVLLIKPLEQGSFTLGVVGCLAEVVEFPANLLGPSACRVRE